MKALLVLIVLFLPIVPAKAALTRDAIAQVSADPPAGAHLDPGFSAPDIQGRMRNLAEILAGRPGFLLFIDYSCHNICGTELALLGAAIGREKLAPSSFRILAIGIDPKDPPQAARAMENAQIPEPLRSSAVFMRPDADMLHKATAALGYRYAYDAENDQFAHAAAVYLIDSKGRLRDVLSPFALLTTDLRALLTSSVTPVSFAERVKLLCYGYDPATGIYSARIAIALKAAMALTVIGIGGLIFHLVRRERSAP